jgi:DNA repair protein RecN (Recombination protein N)
MLTTLQIRDLAVVAALTLEFTPGLTVLTGETGAGKSILLTALGLALGGRADAGMVRPGSPRAEVCVEFDLRQAVDVRLWLADHELDQGETCLIRRTVAADGRSRGYINDRPVTLQALQEFAANLVEIHGQHAHVKLIQGKEQRRLLDEAAGNSALVQALEALFKRWQKTHDELAELQASVRDRAAREELLRYQIDELLGQQVDSLDYAALVEEHSRLANMGRILELGQSQIELLYEDDRQSVHALLQQSLHALGELQRLDGDCAEFSAMVQEAQIQVKEAGHGLRRHLESLETDPQRYDTLDQRLGNLHNLARKHQVKAEQLAAHLQALQSELAGLESGGERLQLLQAELARLEADYRKQALHLSQRRCQQAVGLQEQISGIIQDLGMPQGRFVVAVTPRDDGEMRPHGLDQIEFLVSANPGLPPRPLAKVASGGELSRISLAIQVTLIDGKATPTLIFDEVDTGIGGRVAEIVGQKLRTLGQSKQVLCVTHLAQVAAQGHAHLLVEKTAQGEVTSTSVRPLGAEERVAEIARMLGGIRITEQTLAHAREMLETAAAPTHS